ncbi:hypothetical protein P8452_43396 [Trifolium repens]|nr:hypothetical protein P8452_43396 [Trifolium repens]
MPSQESVSGLIKSLPNIQRLFLESCCNKTLYADIISPSHLISLKYLKIDCVNLDERGELLYIVSILKSASNLVELFIESNNGKGEQESAQLEELERNCYCFSQLQTLPFQSHKRALQQRHWMISSHSQLIPNPAVAEQLPFHFYYTSPDVFVVVSLSSLTYDSVQEEGQPRRSH